jgi:hypothetical protein
MRTLVRGATPGRAVVAGAGLEEIVHTAGRGATLVLAGTEDDDHSSADALAATLPNGHYAGVPGNRTTAVSKPELGALIADFLDGYPER